MTERWDGRVRHVIPQVEAKQRRDACGAMALLLEQANLLNERTDLDEETRAAVRAILANGAIVDKYLVPPREHSEA